LIASIVEDRPKGSVVDQDPDAGREVKPGRKVYLVLNAHQPKMIDMPQLVDLSKRQALSVLEILGLKVRELLYKPDPCTDCVIAQLYKGRPIAADERIRRGEAITLVLGAGERGERVPVPALVGLTQRRCAAGAEHGLVEHGPSGGMPGLQYRRRFRVRAGAAPEPGFWRQQPHRFGKPYRPLAQHRYGGPCVRPPTGTTHRSTHHQTAPMNLSRLLLFSRDAGAVR
jgi:hypothetical protein